MLALALLGLVVSAANGQETSAPAGAGAKEGAGGIQFEVLRYRDRVGRDGGYRRTMDVRVKLPTPAAVAEFGQIGAPYADGLAEVSFEEVEIQKPDGRRVPAGDSRIEDVSPWGMTTSSVPADLRFRKMTLAGLEPGDRLSYRLVVDHKPLAAGHTFGDMTFFTVSSPVHSYELDLPRDLEVKLRLRPGLGVAWEEVAADPDRLVRRLALEKRKPADAAESGGDAAKPRGLEPDVAFTTFDSWDEVSRWWWGISKDRFAADGAVAKEAAALAGAVRDPREKLAALHAFLAGRIRYLSVSFGLGRLQPRAPAEVLSQRYGDCKDKHVLLATLAASLGVDVRPVLVSSTRRELADEVPSPGQFDHMISVARLGPAESDWLWLDTTNPFGLPGYLLPVLRDKRALLVEKDGQATLVRTPKDPPFVPRYDVAIKGTLSPEGVLRGRVAWTLRSDLDVAFRAYLAATPEDGRGAFLGESLGRVWGGKAVANVAVPDLQDGRIPLQLQFDAETTVEAKGGERKVWVPFTGFPLPEPDEDAAPGSPPVTFSIREGTEKAEIEIPEGRAVHLPLSVTLDRPFGSFRSHYALHGRVLSLERTLSLSKVSLSGDDLASYVAFREAIETDRRQNFVVTGADAAPAEVTAKSLRESGLQAFKKKDFVKAAELFAKSGEADSKEKDVFVDLGRALVEQRKYEESIQAFSRQIEVAPFHEAAYGWRGHSRRQLGDWPGAEKDFEKQIEVAPFKAYSYEQLARRRADQGRHADAAELFARAATLEPTVASRWIDLARAQVTAGKKEEARRSLGQAAVRDAAEGLKLDAAALYQGLGDLAAAGQLAASTMPSLVSHLSQVKAERVREEDRRRTGLLADAWRLVGQAAAAAGEVEKAERYLTAAWQLTQSPEAGWALGELRETQGRLAEAVDLWIMASEIPGGFSALPADRTRRIAAAAAKLPEPSVPPRTEREGGGAYVVTAETPRETAAKARLNELRTLRLSGPVTEELEAEVLVLVDPSGRVEKLAPTGKAPPEFPQQVAKLEPARLEWSRPEEASHKAVLKGRLVCSPEPGCVLLRHLPPETRTAVAEAAGSVTIVKLDPPEGTVLRKGQTVTVTATLRYEAPSDGAAVGLVVREGGRMQLSGAPPIQLVKLGRGEVTQSLAVKVHESAERVELMAVLGARAGAGNPKATVTYLVR